MPPTLPTNLAAIVALLCGLIARHGLARGLAGPLIVQIWRRVRIAGTKVETLLARLQAGTLRRHPHRRPAKPRAAPRRRPAPGRLPRKRGWLVALVPETAVGAAQLQHLLASPELPALLEAAPQLRRALRPLCHMLGASLPPPPEPPAAPSPPSPSPRPARRRDPARPPPRSTPPRTTPAHPLKQGVRGHPAPLPDHGPGRGRSTRL